jgi:hypothetical protein
LIQNSISVRQICFLSICIHSTANAPGAAGIRQSFPERWKTRPDASSSPLGLVTKLASPQRVLVRIAVANAVVVESQWRKKVQALNQPLEVPIAG